MTPRPQRDRRRRRFAEQLRGVVAVDRRRADRRVGDAGLITPFVLGMIVALVAVFGLVYDAGGALGDRQRAADLAEQAARAGADVVTADTVSSVQPRVDPTGATTAARGYLHAAGVAGTVHIANNTVEVTVTLSHRTQLLSAIGIDTLTLTASATARPLPGLRTQAGG